MVDDIKIPPKQVAVKKRRSFFAELCIRMVKEKPLGTIGGIIVLILLLTGIFANFIAPYGMNEVNLFDRLEGPSSKYWLGTDGSGRDMFSRIVYGARISMIVSLGATSIAAVVANIIGISSGFLGGKFDIIIQRFVDAWMCFPSLFLILSLMAVMGQGLFQVVVVIGMQMGISGSRVIRSAVIGIRQNVYVESARVIGVPTGMTLLRHILPNIMATVITLFSLNMGTAILNEATISFLGFGVPPPQPSWGGMLSGTGSKYLLQSPLMAVWPGLCLAIAVFGMNMLGDGIRDILDPRLRGGIGRYHGVKVKKPLLETKK
ncbi:MAG: ABC transporter permease [Dehalococcoidales bacterium]|nr:ABC transporter permease [Dehalococcoidales bacterium]